jgi:hypothetical protein
MPRVVILLSALLLAVAAQADQQTFKVKDGQVTFLTPSSNIQCTYTRQGGGGTYMPADGGPELQCDRAEPNYLRFILGKAGAGQKISNVGDAGCCGGENVLDYGALWSLDPFTCVSSSKGLTCVRDDGRGFFISKSRTDVW